MLELLKKLKLRFTYFFQEILVFHVSSLHFRAKVLAVVISCNPDYSDEEIKLLEKISKEIYSKDDNRANMLKEVTLYYVKKVFSKKDSLNLDRLVIDISRQTKKTPRFKYKILVDLLVQFTTCIKNSESSIIQYRVLEFLEDLKGETNPKHSRDKT
jgi:hypothetical protein